MAFDRNSQAEYRVAATAHGAAAAGPRGGAGDAAAAVTAGDSGAACWMPPLRSCAMALLVGAAGGALAAVWLKLMALNGT